MIDRLKILVSSKPWFWKLRTWLGRIGFLVERNAYRGISSVNKAKDNARIFGSFTWIGLKSLCWVVLALIILIFAEGYVRNNSTWLPPLNADDKKFSIDQLRLYAQLLTAIFSIYFATIGIILSAGYTRLRRDIIQMLTNEQVGSVYSRVLVLAAMFCLAATTLPLFGFEPSLFVYTTGSILALLSALALFPLGQRLFNFFDLNLLVRSEILPSIARFIEGAANPNNSISLANHHSAAARKALEQLFYIDDRVKTFKESLEDNLPALSNDYTVLLLHYIQRKHSIDHESYWFPRRTKHKQWFLAGDSATTMALNMSSQEVLVEKKVDYQWLEDQIVEKLASHVELALEVGDFKLALELMGHFSGRASVYAREFQFALGIKEIDKFKEIIKQAFSSIDDSSNVEEVKTAIALADNWAAMGSYLCIETLRRMITFETELKQFFEADEWDEKSLRRLPALLQVELALIVKRIEFEREIEGKRLSKPKYIQQLAVQKLLDHYSKVLPLVCNFYRNTLPDFVLFMANLKMPEAATQVILASLHSHWKLPRWFDELGQLVVRYQEYQHYTEEQYKFCEISIDKMSERLASARDDAITLLGNQAMVSHIFEQKHDDELPDHFGQIYFELAEACINALEKNDSEKLDKVLPMFLSLAFLAADSKFPDQSFEVNKEFRVHLVSAVINDLASVLGFSMLYGGYFSNKNLSARGLAIFDSWIENITDKQQYLKRMLVLSDPLSFSVSRSPRDFIRTNWKISFEHLVTADGFEDQMGMVRGKVHPNKVVRIFLKSHSDASHLFFAKHVLPRLVERDFDIDRRIIDLECQFLEGGEEVLYEDS